MLTFSKNQFTKFTILNFKFISDLKTFIFSIKKFILYTHMQYVAHVSVCKLYKKKKYLSEQKLFHLSGLLVTPFIYDAVLQ